MSQLLFPWIIILESIVLLAVIGIAYSSNTEALESSVGPHLLHIVTISLLTITSIEPSEEAKSYAKVYAWTNMGMDNISLCLMLFRYSQSTALHLRGSPDSFYFGSYVVGIILLIIIDTHNISFTFRRAPPKSPKSPKSPIPAKPRSVRTIEDGRHEASDGAVSRYRSDVETGRVRILPMEQATDVLYQHQHPSLLARGTTWTHLQMRSGSF